MKRLFYIAIISWMILFSGCDSNTTFQSSVPTYPVQFDLNILAEYPHFVPANGYQTMTITKQRYPQDYLGYAGLLLWTANNQYYAADLCCPNCVHKGGAVEVDGIFARCPVCGEEYDLSAGLGVPTKGISHELLRQYSATYDNYMGILRIRQRP